MKKAYIYKGFERFWHWTQASLIIFLALTGFEVHGSFSILGFEQAARYHRSASWLLIVLIVFAIFWHFVTGEWKQYIPTTNKLKEQIRYYSFGMFKGEKHPTKKTGLTKLNPLQRLVYLSFKLFLVPVTIVSGIFYMLQNHRSKRCGDDKRHTARSHCFLAHLGSFPVNGVPHCTCLHDHNRTYPYFKYSSHDNRVRRVGR